MWIFIASMLVIMFMPLNTILKLVLCMVLLLGLLFSRRSTLLYAKAIKLANNPNEDEVKKAWPLLEKARKIGLSEQFEVTSASIYIQKGDYHVGEQILQDLIARKNKVKNQAEHQKLVNISQTMLSMVFWLNHDLDGAIAQMEKVYQSGYRDKNVYVNYETYLLEKGDLKRAGQLLAESEGLEKQAAGIVDNRGWYYLLKGDWEQALATLQTLLERTPAFPEPYIHAAQAYLHFGKVKEALQLLEQAKDSHISNTSGIKRPFIEEFLKALSDPKTRMVTALSADKDTASVALGRMPVMLENIYPATEASFLEGFAVMKQEQEKEKKQNQEDDDERLPDTSLSKEDEEYLKSHGLS